MKKKCFFGILLSLFLLCGGVFLLTLEKSFHDNPFELKQTSNADDIVITIETGNLYGILSGTTVATLDGTVAIRDATNAINSSKDFSLDLKSGESTTITIPSIKYGIFNAITDYRTITIDSCTMTGESSILNSRTTLDNSGGRVSCSCSSSLRVKEFTELKDFKWEKIDVGGTMVNCTFRVNVYFGIYYNCEYNDGSGRTTGFYYSTYDEVMKSKPTIPTRTGYTFKGFFELIERGAIIVDEKGNWTGAWGQYTAKPAPLYAKWEKNKYTVKLNQNGGSDGTTSVTATYDSNMPPITIPDRTGYKFLGYYDTSATSGGTQYYTSTGASARRWNKTSDTTLFARWEKTTLNYTYDYNGGSGSINWGSAKYGDTITLPTPNARNGYKFKGWLKSGTSTNLALAPFIKQDIVTM